MLVCDLEFIHTISVYLQPNAKEGGRKVRGEGRAAARGGLVEVRLQPKPTVAERVSHRFIPFLLLFQAGTALAVVCSHLHCDSATWPTGIGRLALTAQRPAGRSGQWHAAQHTQKACAVGRTAGEREDGSACGSEPLPPHWKQSRRTMCGRTGGAAGLQHGGRIWAGPQ